MINGATVTLAGYVATDPHYRTTNNKKTPIVSMRVAWTSRYMDRETGEWRDGKTSFANVNCWRKLANNVAPSLRKGQAVVIMGRLQVREFDDREGKRRIAVDIDADAVGHDLSRGVAHFQRTFRSDGEGAGGRPEGLAMGEAIRAGLADEDVPDQDAAGLPAAAPETGEATGASGDMFNPDAISQLAGATDLGAETELAGETELARETELAGETEGAAAAAVPF